MNPKDSEDRSDPIKVRHGKVVPPALDEEIESAMLRGPLSTSARVRILKIAEAESDPLVFEQAVELLVKSERLRDWLGIDLVDLLLRRAVPREDAKLAYMAATALIGATTLLLPEDRDGRRLDAALLLRDVPTGVNLVWAQAAAHAAGAAYAYWTEEPLRNALSASLQNLREHPEAGPDALVELGHAYLFDSVTAGERSDLEAALHEAEACFSAAARAQEERVDAELMINVVAAIRGFGLGGDPRKTDAHAQAALELWRDRAMYTHLKALPEGARRATEAKWGTLIARLPKLARELDAPIWTRGAEAVRLLLEAIEAASAVALGPAEESNANRLVTPRIEESLARNMGQRQMLAAVLAEEELDETRLAAATTLLGEAPSTSENQGGTIDEVLGPQLRALEEEVATPAFEQFRSKAEALLSGRPLNNRDAQWLETYEATLRTLEGSPDYESDRQQDIRRLISDLLDFLSRCLQAQLNFGGGILKYLGEPDAKEGQMADHLYSHLKDIGGWDVTSEVPQEGAGGRVDLRVAMGADRFVIECKRDHSPVSEESVGHYLAQTERYLGVSLRIASLVVLDLTPKDRGPAPTLDNSVWVSDVPPPPDRPGSARKVVCLVVPGNRAATPSEVGKRAPRTPE